MANLGIGPKVHIAMVRATHTTGMAALNVFLLLVRLACDVLQLKLSLYTNYKFTIQWHLLQYTTSQVD